MNSENGFILAEAAQRFGNIPAFMGARGVVTYAEYFEAVLKAAARFHDLGLKRGDRVLIALQDAGDYPVLIMALIYLGCIAAPVDSRLPAM